MRYLIETAPNLGLDEIVDRALEYENVHGIVVTIHERWLDLMALEMLKKYYDAAL